MSKSDYRKWNVKDVLAEIKNLKNLSPRYVQNNFSGLYGAAIRLCGSWKNAVEAAGIEYERAISRKIHGFWTKERVIEEIRNLKEFHSGDAKKTNIRLYSAAIRIFNGWKEALAASGINHDSLMRSRKKVQFLKMHSKKINR